MLNIKTGIGASPRGQSTCKTVGQYAVILNTRKLSKITPKYELFMKDLVTSLSSLTESLRMTSSSLWKMELILLNILMFRKEQSWIGEVAEKMDIIGSNLGQML